MRCTAGMGLHKGAAKQQQKNTATGAARAASEAFGTLGTRLFH